MTQKTKLFKVRFKTYGIYSKCMKCKKKVSIESLLLELMSAKC